MMNIRIMHGKYEKEKDYDLFGYTYIKAEHEPQKKEPPRKPVKSLNLPNNNRFKNIEDLFKFSDNKKSQN